MSILPSPRLFWSLIAAADRHGGIGIVDERGSCMPWHLPDDLAWFKRTTMGRPVVMGRRTHESIGRALPGRLNVVLTRDRTFTTPNVVVACDLDAAENAVQEAVSQPGEAFIIGGADVYAQALPRARRLYLTEIDHVFDTANRHVPEFAPERVRDSGWHEVSRERRSSVDGWGYAFVVYEREHHGR